MMIPIAKSSIDLGIVLKRANRHGLITGATGTGKTVTLKVMAEQFSKAGVPIFLADIKGDLASLAELGVVDDNIGSRLESLEITDYEPQRYPVRLWDVFAESGTPVRATVSEMGPLLLSRLLGLNETQTGVLNIVFKLADDQGLLILDLKDLQAVLQEIGDNAAEYTTQYGNITRQSVGAIQRSLLVLEQQGADKFFGEPAIKLSDFMTTDQAGRGYINILMAKELFSSPLLYSTFLMWMLSELFEELPEVGDPEKPRMVFFFDEAHLLVKNSPASFVDQVEQVVRLIRSKGVGVYFITQSPTDLPDNILNQLGNRVQHAIRAYTPKELKVVKAAASTFRQNPDIDVSEVITQLKVGEALVSFLDEDGQPTVVERAFVRPPESKISAVDPLIIPSLISLNPLDQVYRQTVDRESAYEILASKFQQKVAEKETAQAEAVEAAEEKARLKQEKEEEKQRKEKERATKNNPVNKAMGQFISTSVRTVSRELTRSIMGILKKK